MAGHRGEVRPALHLHRAGPGAGRAADRERAAQRARGRLPGSLPPCHARWPARRGTAGRGAPALGGEPGRRRDGLPDRAGHRGRRLRAPAGRPGDRSRAGRQRTHHRLALPLPRPGNRLCRQPFGAERAGRSRAAVSRAVKVSGGGNDFLALIEPDRLPTCAEIAAWCARGLSIGADGLFVLARDGGRVRMDYWNADGRPAALCINGTRCAARLAFDLGWAAEKATIVTGAGPFPARPAGPTGIALELPPPT
ncbi:MAG: hypothetical protein F9K16_12565, partial [Thermoanaerobaculia bacterium]